MLPNESMDIRLSIENDEIKILFERNGCFMDISNIKSFIEHCKYHEEILKSDIPSYKKEESRIWAKVYKKYLIFKALTKKQRKNGR